MPENDGVAPSPPPNRSFWRFSMRELLLLTLAIAAFVGWGVTTFRRYRPFAPTPFASQINLEADIVAVCQQIGDTKFRLGGMRSDGSSTSGRRYQCDYELSFRLTTANARTFMKALQQRLSEQIEASGCQLGATGYRGSSFRLNYERGSAEGVVRVYLNAGDDRAQMLVFVQEQWQPP